MNFSSGDWCRKWSILRECFQATKIVVQARLEAPIRWMGELNDVCRPGGRCNGGSKAENEAPAHEDAFCMARSLHSRSDQDEQAPNKDADAPDVAIGEETTERERGYHAKVVDDENNASRGTSTGKAECALICLHSIDGALYWLVSKTRVTC
jgi:hypothetical protein